MGRVLRPAPRVRVPAVTEGFWEGRRAGRVTHWLAERLGLRRPHVQMGHHGLQPLALLGKLWGHRRWAGAVPSTPLPPPHPTRYPRKPLFLSILAPSVPCSWKASALCCPTDPPYPEGQEWGCCLLCEALPLLLQTVNPRLELITATIIQGPSS